VPRQQARSAEVAHPDRKEIWRQTISPWMTRECRRDNQLVRPSGLATRKETHPEPGGDARDKVKAVRHLVAERADDPAPVEELQAGLEGDRLDVLGLEMTGGRAETSAEAWRPLGRAAGMSACAPAGSSGSAQTVARATWRQGELSARRSAGPQRGISAASCELGQK
jgi:hypothetical protein